MSQTWVHEARIKVLNDARVKSEGRCVIYWMQKDQRSRDNWALVRAIELANQYEVPLVVAFFVWDGLKNAYLRHFEFMLRGLSEVAADLDRQQIGFVMRRDEPVHGIVALREELQALAVVTDQGYLRLAKRRRERAALALSVPLEAIDAAMIVPPAVLSDKQLYAAYIARPKLRDYSDEFLTNYPSLRVKVSWTLPLEGLEVARPDSILHQLRLDTSVGPVSQVSGMTGAEAVLKAFIKDGVARYKDDSNDPTASSTSQLSAYLHYGQLSAQRIAWELRHAPSYAANQDSTDKYLDELITWRELSTNFVCYNNNYDSYEGLPEWARKSLEIHANDEREFVYDLSQFEAGLTHDELWNAAQMEMTKSGRMHGYMRMYWAKKILEWTSSPQIAIDIAVYLNDKYELDGREPGGYAGILWAIGGLHDRPWFEREIYGQVRYMNYNGAKKKFNVPAYIAHVNDL
ncbi:deoxyribodipyrimidine photo-lyase [Candidatus Saccharibacteria bacterium]|nr:deoxyribodipyrimidine photo-lyase [Candidatus Saccharibacteria bacterium]